MKSSAELSSLKPVHEFLSAYQVTVAAFVSGATGVFIGYPLDHVKTRMQSYPALYSSIPKSFAYTFQHEGVLGFYRGVQGSLWIVSALKASSFGLNDYFKKSFTSEPKVSGFKRWLTWFTAGSLTGQLMTIITGPLELIKIQLQLQMLRSIPRSPIPHPDQQTNLLKSQLSLTTTLTHQSFPLTTTTAQNQEFPTKSKKIAPRFTGNISCFLWILRSYSIKGLYQGTHIHWFRELVGSGIYFSTYESFKYLTLNSFHLALTPTLTLLHGGLSGR